MAIPRYWRFVAQLPQNSMGKTLNQALVALFTEKEDQLFPDVLAHSTASDTQVDLRLSIGQNLKYFAGHFPGQPVLPGVVQVHWAEHYARQAWPKMGSFMALEAIKFQRVISQNTELELQLSWNPEKTKLSFVYATQTGVYSSGRIAFRHPETH